MIKYVQICASDVPVKIGDLDFRIGRQRVALLWCSISISSVALVVFVGTSLGGILSVDNRNSELLARALS